MDPHSLEKTNARSDKKAEYYLGKITQLSEFPFSHLVYGTKIVETESERF